MQQNKIIHSQSFYARTIDSKVHKFTFTIYEKNTGFLNMKRVYYAEMHVFKSPTVKKTMPIGNRTTKKTEWTDLNDLISISNRYFKDIYQCAEEDRDYIAVTNIRENDDDPLTFDPPAFNIENIIDTAESPLHTIIDVLKKRLGDNTKVQVEFTDLRYSGAKSTETPPPPPAQPQEKTDNFKHIEENLEALEKKGPKYKALCKRYGKKKIDALINNMKSKK